jgi:asparagine synthase (glutamine-hydrolysing)
MADAIVHRGPDDDGFHAGDGAIIGMRRLSIIDLSGGHQPIANEDETLWLVCNGEIYNFQPLRERLKQAGHRFRTGSDVEVILHLYEEYGDRFVDHITGMYAVALWDAKRQRLILVRDRMGQKPLYYSVSNGRLVFGSEVKSLLRSSFVKADIERSALRDYLALGYAPSPGTMFAGIHKLPPASTLIWEQGAFRIQSYWQIPSVIDTKRSEKDWSESIRSELERAVADHMISDVPIGAFLSGGIDSSAVVALMARHSSRPVNTYSIGYTGGSTESYYNELSFAKQVAERFGTHHTEIPVKPQVAKLLPKLLWHVEEPISDSAMLTTFLVSELAAKSVKVILSGVGGDELFAGYRRYLGEHYNRQYRRIPAWIRNGLLRPAANRLPSGRQNKLMDLSRYARKFIQAADLDWRSQYRQYMEITARAQVDFLLSEPTAKDSYDAALAAEVTEDELLRLFRVDAQTQLPEDLLLLTDKITMATSIECRVPFLDQGLVELAATIPAHHKLPGGELKGLLKRSLEGVLPHDVLYRSKRGFGAPVGQWLKRDLLPLRSALLSKQVVESRGLVSWTAVERAMQQHDGNREDYSDLLFVLLNLELWCRLFIDGRSADDLGIEMSELAGSR